VTFGLFGDVAPRTVENFRALATGQEVGSAAAQGFSSHEPLEPSMCCCTRTNWHLQAPSGMAGYITQLRSLCCRARQQMAWCCTTRGPASIGSFQVAMQRVVLPELRTTAVLPRFILGLSTVMDASPRHSSLCWLQDS
jgi:hypothetical protein